MNATPIGGSEVAPVNDDGELVIVDFKKLPSFEPLFLFKFLILHLGNKFKPILGDLISL